MSRKTRKLCQCSPGGSRFAWLYELESLKRPPYDSDLSPCVWPTKKKIIKKTAVQFGVCRSGIVPQTGARIIPAGNL